MADTKQTKTIGEHYVAAELARRGWAPALTRDGIERTDILAVRASGDARVMVEVQVKTAQGRNFDAVNWPLGRNAQKLSEHDREFFVLVALAGGAGEAPRYFIVPRDHLVAAAWISHTDWLTDPNAPEGKRNAGVEMARVRLGVFDGYEDRWDLLEIPSTRAPVLLRPWMAEAARGDRVGLPEGHPWKLEMPTWGDDDRRQ